MHRVVLGAQDGQQIDHINGDNLDNRRANLRFCSNAQNQYHKRPQRSGTSMFKGVSFHKHHGKWQARITYSGHTYQLGSFADERLAAIAYDVKAHELFGEFALTNFPSSETSSL